MTRLASPVVLFLVFLSLPVVARASTFDLEEYRRQLEQESTLTGHDLLQRHAPLGPYLERVPEDGRRVAYLDSVITIFELTDDEVGLIERHGFMVSERLAQRSYGSVLRRVWHADLPVFLSSDLILHTIHRSFDEILKSIEMSTLIPLVDDAFQHMRDALPDLAATYATDPRMDVCLADLDLYTSVALELLRQIDTPPLRPELASLHDEIIAAALAANGVRDLPLFNETPRKIDFSQFQPRGHYTDTYLLERYFRCMIWVGRTDFRLSIPPGVGAPPSVRREIVDAFLLRELVVAAGVREALTELDEILQRFIGASDNTTLAQLDAIATALEFSNAAALWDDPTADAFDALLETDDFQPQAINSRVLIGDPMSGEPLDPPYAFLLMGQRFTVDSNVLGNVVYDRIRYDGGTPFRGLPDPLDVIYTLGNDDVLPLLTQELEDYHYAPNLSAMRTLMESYDDEYWDSSLYTHWVSALRTLNATGSQDGVPDFMKTAAWQQAKTNTQLASWAELRHDTILYVKQSYTGGITCSYPDGYVEPVPDLYRRLGDFADYGASQIAPLLDEGAFGVGGYFSFASAVMDTLETLARKELEGEPFVGTEATFIRRALFEEFICTLNETGWLPWLYYDGGDAPVSEPDRVIADVHTQPTDESGAVVGKVLHVATANPMLGVFVASCPGGAPTAYCGPVASYRELVAIGFDRLTDEEWETILDQGAAGSYVAPSTEAWTHLYTADAYGSARTGAISLLDASDQVSIDPGDDDDPSDQPSTFSGVGRVRGVPNPFNPRTVIGYEITGRRSVTVTVEILNTRGERVKTLVRETLAAGNYVTPWNGDDDQGRAVASGVYIARVIANGQSRAVKLALVR